MIVRMPTLIVTLLLITAVPTALLAEADAKPNVLFVAVDDLNVNVGCYGARDVKTPHLDALAARGLRFDRAYANYPTCNGSRTSMLSGRYPESTGILLNSTNPREKLPDAIFLPEYFKRHGYFTAALGKITHGGFAHALRCDEIVDEQKVTPRSILRKDLPFAWAATDNADAEEPDGSIARQAVRLLEQHHNERFFIAVGFHRPHVPHAAPQKYFDLYPPAAMKLHDRGGADHTPAAARNKFYPQLSRSKRQQIVANYSAATSFMDAQLGVVLGALDRLGLTENTIVVFWSDHGWHLGDHGGMWAKGTLMESSARIPLIIAAPGKAIGACGRVVESVDLYPTLAALCGLGAPEHMHGSSFAQLLDNPQAPQDHLAYVVKERRNDFSRSIRDARYMYAEYPGGATQLYDLINDPGELENLAGNAKHAEEETRMKRLLHQRMKQAKSDGV